VAQWNVEQHIHSARQAGWPDRIHAVFKRHAIKQVGYVADNGIARLIDLCERDNEITEVALASEAEGAGLPLSPGGRTRTCASRIKDARAHFLQSRRPIDA
jgi:hypothetical protein